MFTYPVGLLSPKGGIPLDGLIARWDGGSIINTAPDFIGVYDGTLNGSPLPSLTTGINGEANGAYDFVSANLQYIAFDIITEIKDIPKITISSWFKKTTGSDLAIGDCVVHVTRGSRLQWFTDDKTYVLIRDGGTNALSEDETSELDSWVNIIGTLDGTLNPQEIRMEMYINLVSVGTLANINPSVTTAELAPFWIGRYVGGYSDGQIAQTLVYNRILNASERANIFAEKT